MLFLLGERTFCRTTSGGVGAGHCVLFRTFAAWLAAVLVHDWPLRAPLFFVPIATPVCPMSGGEAYGYGGWHRTEEDNVLYHHVVVLLLMCYFCCTACRHQALGIRPLSVRHGGVMLYSTEGWSRCADGARAAPSVGLLWHSVEPTVEKKAIGHTAHILYNVYL